MSNLLKTLLLGVCLLLLSYFIFGGGLIFKFFDVSESLTNPAHMQAMAFGGGEDFAIIVTFIFDLVIFLLLSAVLIFLFNLFSKKKD
jgi:hypothetical protein